MTPIPPTHPFSARICWAPQDIAGAKKLLAEAGFGERVVGRDCSSRAATADGRRLATTFRDAAKQAGITVTLRIVPQDKFYAEMEGKIAFSVDGFFGRPTPDTMLYAWYHSSGSWNNTLWHYNNPEVDKILVAARVTGRQGRTGEAVQPVPGDRREGRAWLSLLRAQLRLRREPQGAGVHRLATDVGRHQQRDDRRVTRRG